MKIIAHKAHFFAEKGKNGTVAKHLNIPRSPGIQEVPDWISATDTFKAGVQDGAIAVIPNALPAGVVGPPSVEDIMKGGRTRAEAMRIAADEQRKFEAGEYPYPPRTEAVETEQPREKLSEPTLNSLMAAGLSKEDAQAALDRRNGKVTAPTSDGGKANGKANGGSRKAKSDDAKSDDKKDDSAAAKSDDPGAAKTSDSGESAADVAKS